MRQAIETAPIDGTFVILEDDASGTHDVAHWSTKAGEWVGEDGEPIKITPTHWYQVQPQHSAAGDVRASRSVVTAAPVIPEAFMAQTVPVEAKSPPYAQRFAASSLTATIDRYAGRYGIFGISMMGIFGISMMGILGIIMMGGQIAEQASRLPSDKETSSFSRDITLQPRTESDQTTAQAHVQVKQAVEATAQGRAKELQQEGQRAPGLANENVNEAAQLKRVADNAASELQRERERAEALGSELAKVRREVETAAAVSRRKDDEAMQLKRNPEAAVTELRQSLQGEQKKTAALMQEAKASQATTTAAEQQRRALEEAQARAAALASELAGKSREIEIQAAQSQKTIDEATEQKQAAEAATAELRQSLQREHQRAETLSIEVRNLKAPATLSRQGHAEDVQLKQGATEGKGKGSEAAGLLARANALVGQGNIRAARDLLERAAETGSAQATFALAETYDPNVLATWRTLGTRGDVTKARNLYAKAYEGGIKAAKDRSHALVIAGSERKPAGWFGRDEADH